jgi:hypothetical protein
LPFELGSVAIDLALLFVLPSVLRHQLIADQSSGDQPDRPADQSADSRMTDGAADDGTCAGADARADKSALLPLSQRLGAAAQDQGKRARYQHSRDFAFHRMTLLLN